MTLIYTEISRVKNSGFFWKKPFMIGTKLKHVIFLNLLKVFIRIVEKKTMKTANERNKRRVNLGKKIKFR